MEKYLELAKKLKMLAEKGSGGEKLNAEMMLKKLMEKHGFTMQDIEGEEKLYHYFKVGAKDRFLFDQVASTVLGSTFSIFGDQRKRGYLVLEVTAAEAIEIENKYDFYLQMFETEYEIFKSAFIRANNLYPKDSAEIKLSDLSAEEIEKHKKTIMMANSMDAKPYQRRLMDFLK